MVDNQKITIAEWSGGPGNPFGKFCLNFKLYIIRFFLIIFFFLIYFVILFSRRHIRIRDLWIYITVSYIIYITNIYNILNDTCRETGAGRNVRFLISDWMKTCTWPNFSASDCTNPIRKIGIVSFIKFYVKNMNKIKKKKYLFIFIFYIYIFILFFICRRQRRRRRDVEFYKHW